MLVGVGARDRLEERTKLRRTWCLTERNHAEFGTTLNRIPYWKDDLSKPVWGAIISEKTFIVKHGAKKRRWPTAQNGATTISQ
jgi:hypothetical protein